jgi:HD-like signal output (HDOD) protein
LANSVLSNVKVEIDEELWYGASSDEVAEAVAAKSMAARMGRIVGAKPFPAAAQRLSQITQDPNCQMDDVVSVLESDPALSARLLRLVNSVGFSLRTACTSVRHAAALVGTEKLNQVASTAAILDMYESGNERAKELLEHATVVGALCRYLAFHFGLPPDELFTCGFLHDIGKLMLLETEGAEYLELLGAETPDFDTTHIEERKRFGFDHALLAGHVLAAWNIPQPVPKVVAWHHHVTRAYAESTTISQMVSTLRLADAMSFALLRPDTQAQIETLARMEAASYMDISEGQLAAMWEEVRALTERARAVFRGEKVEDALMVHTSRPSGASMRAVARAKNQDRVSLNGGSGASLRAGSLSAPAVSERSRQFPCVVCAAPSYAHRCGACHGYMCPLHVAGEDEWCELCQGAYEEAGIPSIRPLVSTLFGALAGALVAAAFFGAASAGAQRPLRIMIGPTLILMALGMLAGVGQRWIRRWWFLRSRTSRASIVPPTVETLIDMAALQNLQIVEIESGAEIVPVLQADPLSLEPQGPVESSPDIRTETPGETPEQLSLMHPDIPAPPALPQMEAPPSALPSTPPRSMARERTWMSSRTPHPSVAPERLESIVPSGVPVQASIEPPAPRGPAPARSMGAPPPREAGPVAPEAQGAEERDSARAERAQRAEEPARAEQGQRAALEPPPAVEARAEPERASEPLPASEERVVEGMTLEAELHGVAAEQSAVAVRGSRAGGSVRAPANDSRPPSFAPRSDRASSRSSRPSGPPRLVQDRTVRARPTSSPPSSQRLRPSSPALAARPTPAPVEPFRQVASASPRPGEGYAPTILQVQGAVEARAAMAVPEPVRVAALEAAAPSASVSEAAPPAADAWRKVLDALGSADGW